MAFSKLVLIAVVGVVLYNGWLPDPLSEFLLKVKEDFLFMFFRTLVITTRLCLSHAEKLQKIGENVCDGLCPAYGDPKLAHKQQVAFFVANLLQQTGDFLYERGVEYLSDSLGVIAARIYMWALVEGA